MKKQKMDELNKIRERYDERNKSKLSSLYTSSNPDIYMSGQEKERALFKLFKASIDTPLSEINILEIGCGRGYKILDLLRMGFSPDKIIGNELMPDNIADARRLLPTSVKLIEGDARALPIATDSLDIVYQSMVFSSILDDDFQKELADLCWSWIKPGGGILWYDFTYNNPNNSAVKGVKEIRVKKLFPEADSMSCKRITLAPPISRKVATLNPNLYSLVNLLPFLRTHILCYIQKPNQI